MNAIAPKTKRPVTESGWYETVDGRAAYFCGGCHKDGFIGMKCTQVREKSEVWCLTGGVYK